MDLEKLKITNGLIDETTYNTEYVNVSQYKSLSLCGISDVPLTIRFVFSVNGLDDGPADFSFVNFNPNTWTRLKTEVCLPFVKIKVENKNKLKNLTLVINTTGLRLSFPQLQKKNEEEKIERTKSPFRKWALHSKGKEEVKVIPRSPLPEFLPRNAILVGSYVGSYTFIPPPESNKNSYLCFIDGMFVWQEMPEPKKITWKID